jgi:hypothetical protein
VDCDDCVVLHEKKANMLLITLYIVYGINSSIV